MTADDFENLLRLWGFAYGPHRHEIASLASGPGGYGDSPIARFGQTRTIRRVTTMDRGGLARRTAMGAAAGLLTQDGKRTRPVPGWACDPASFTETRSGAAKLLTAGDRDFSPEVIRVERAAVTLQRIDDTLGRVLRAEYCTLGSQAEKAATFAISRNIFRERVAEGRGWMRRELSA